MIVVIVALIDLSCSTNPHALMHVHERVHVGYIVGYFTPTLTIPPTRQLAEQSMIASAECIPVALHLLFAQPM